MIQRAAGPVLALLAFLIGAAGFCAPSFGHALQPGFLELRLVDKDLYAMIWKVPAVEARPMAISALLPELCDPRTPGQPIWDGTAYVVRWTATCPGRPRGRRHPHRRSRPDVDGRARPLRLRRRRRRNPPADARRSVLHGSLATGPA